MRTRCLLMLFSMAAMLGVITAESRAAENAPMDALTSLVRGAKVGVSPWSQQWLGQNRKDIPVPDGVRALFQDISADDVGPLAYCFFHEKGCPAWYWELGPITVRDPDSTHVMKGLSARLGALGFAESKMPPKSDRISDYTRAWQRKKSAEKLEEIVLIGMRPRPIGRPEESHACVWWTVRSTISAPMPTYADVVRALPCMAPPPIPGKYPIPASIVEMLKDQKVSRVLRGGFALQVVVPNDPGSKSNKTLANRVLRRLIAEDYELQPRDETLRDPMHVRFSKSDSKTSNHSDVSLRWSREEFEIDLFSQFDASKN